MLKVSEIFTSIQGEGPSIGKPAVFLRLHGCNLACSWCDTKYATLGKDFKEMSIAEVNGLLTVLLKRFAVASPLVVITGGEPLLQADDLSEVIAYLKRRGVAIEVETNGTILPPFQVTYNVSPKLENSGVPRHSRIKIAVLDEYSKSADCVFKFVCSDTDDLLEIDDIARQACISRDRIIVQPEGNRPDKQLKLLRTLQGAVDIRGYRLLPRLHTLIWGPKRGV